MTMYLSGASNPALRKIAYDANIGLMLNPASRYDPQQLGDYPAFAIDNGCYTQGERFNPDAYLDYLAKMRRWQHKCLFAVAADRYDPSGYWQGQPIAEATWERSRAMLPQIRALGYRAALVAQNNVVMTEEMWAACDVLFIGMDTSGKLSPEPCCLPGRHTTEEKHHIWRGSIPQLACGSRGTWDAKRLTARFWQKRLTSIWRVGGGGNNKRFVSQKS